MKQQVFKFAFVNFQLNDEKWRTSVAETTGLHENIPVKIETHGEIRHDETSLKYCYQVAVIGPIQAEDG